MFDLGHAANILNVVDISYGGENNFNQAIEMSFEILANVKFIQEKRLIGKYFKEISQDTEKYLFGVDDTFNALESGAIETLIVWEILISIDNVVKNIATSEIVIKHLTKEQEGNSENFKVGNTELDVEEKM